jgi:hypothetical protein
MRVENSKLVVEPGAGRTGKLVPIQHKSPNWTALFRYERIHTICLRVIGIAFSGVARERGEAISWKRKGLGGAGFRTLPGLPNTKCARTGWVGLGGLAPRLLRTTSD